MSDTATSSSSCRSSARAADRRQRPLAARQARIWSPIFHAVFPGWNREHTKQTPVLKLAQIDPLRIEVIVPVAQLGRIAVGMRAEVTPETPVTGVFQARVTVVDRVVDAASGTFGVRLELPNPAYRLPAGLKCKVRFLR